MVTSSKPSSSKAAPKAAPKTASKASSKTAPKTASKAAAKPAAPELAPVVEDAALPGGDKVSVELKLKALVDQVVTATGTKKAQARTVTEAVLAALGTALADGQALNLPGLGKARVVRQGEGPGTPMVVKLRRPVPQAAKPAEEKAAEPLANPGEGS